MSQFIVRSLNLALVTAAALGLSGVAHAQAPRAPQSPPSVPGAQPVYLLQAAPAAPGVQPPPLGQPIQVVYATPPTGTSIDGQTTVYYVQHAAPTAVVPVPGVTSDGSFEAGAAPLVAPADAQRVAVVSPAGSAPVVAPVGSAPVAAPVGSAPVAAPTPPVNEAAPATAASVQTAALASQTNDVVSSEQPSHLELRKRGVDFYVGLGGSFATGSFDDDDQFPVSDASVGAVTGVLGVGYRFSPHFYAGGYVEGGVGPLNTSETFDFCNDDSDIECTAGLVRYGIEGRYTFNPEDNTAFWLGAGLGGNVFVASAKVEGGRSLARVTANGTELLLKGGINVAVSKKATMDVFVGVSRGSFDEVEISVLDQSAKVTDPGSNGWLSVGAAFVL